MTNQNDFDKVRSLAVVTDADFDVGAARDRVRGALRDSGLPVPDDQLGQALHDQLSVYYLLPPHEGQGMLENVCLESVGAEPVMDCVDRFIECAGDERTDWPRLEIEAKARVHAYLASKDPPDLRLGEAGEKGFWNFDHQVFNPLKGLLGVL